MLAAEDTRSLLKLMDIHGIPLDGRKITALHDHSSEGAVTRLINAVKDGKSVAYASEAGMPLIADPGFELSRAAAVVGGECYLRTGAFGCVNCTCVGWLAY